MNIVTRLLYPPRDERIPTLMVIGAALQVAFTVLLTGIGKRSFEDMAWAAFGIGLAIATARMNRWGAVGLALLTVLGLVTTLERHGQSRGAGGAIFALALRATIFLPVLLFWDRMTWSILPPRPVPPADPPPNDARRSGATARIACADCGELVDADTLIATRGRRLCESCAEADPP